MEENSATNVNANEVIQKLGNQIAQQAITIALLQTHNQQLQQQLEQLQQTAKSIKIIKNTNIQQEQAS